MPTFCYTPGNLLTFIFLIFFLIPLSHSLNFQLSRSTPHATTVLPEADAVTSVGGVQVNDVDYRRRLDQVIRDGKVHLWDSNSGKLADFTTHFSFTVDTRNSSSNAGGFAFFLAPVGFRVLPNSVGGSVGIYVAGAGDFPQSQTVSIEFDDSANPEDRNVALLRSHAYSMSVRN
ncbi:UNVERIFIED_CONTAM: L-type lectin-domain containing receptor kinase IX.1 [Sesamum latifolium]|uniref:L-type lectin-domain containing receptor kinase IX.1 n=1 Tax=Sesamum latifolium TaxID=2727402 RepID=A0AAW2U0Y9_9LAMI